MGGNVQLVSGICSFWSLYRQFFNKENRKCGLGRFHEIVITDVLYLRTKNIFSINICEWMDVSHRIRAKRGVIVYLKNYWLMFFDTKNKVYLL